VARRRRRSPQVQKAPRQHVQPAATFTAGQVQALLQNQQTVSTGQLATPLPRTEPHVPFGPGIPMQTGAIDPLNPASGRPEPRIYEYPVSMNLPGMTDRVIPWKVLRDAAEIPVVRDCIRIRTNEISSLEWDIVVTKRAMQAHRKVDPDTSSVEIQRRLREQLDPEVSRICDFWEMPDFHQGETWVDWISKLLEEHLVLDAVAIWPFQDRAKAKQGLRILDGSTVKPLLDHLGGRPLAPNPAYQQVLWGFPRGEFIADTDEDGTVLNGFDSDRLIYRRRAVRTITPYGYSAVEQALQDCDLYLRRLEWDKAQYTDGVAPSGWIKNTGMEQWTPQQLADYSRAFNDLYAGQTLSRMRYHLLPPGMEPIPTADIPEKFKPDYHLHLIKLVAMHFDVTMSELGFTESKGLGSAGFHEGEENVQERKATNPTIQWLQALLTNISRTHLGMPRELEFKFLGLDAEDQANADAVVEAQLKTGRITLNEAREEMGRAPYDFDEADMPQVQTARGIIFVEDASLLAPAGEEIVPPQAPPLNMVTTDRSADEADGDDESVAKPAGQPAKPGNGASAGAAGKTLAADLVKAELAAYWKWVRNGRTKRRPFEFVHIDRNTAMLHEVDLGLVAFKAGEADPKVGGRHWPAWEKDLQVAEYWAGVLRSALTGAPTRAIAERWLQVRKAAGDQDRRRDAEQWLIVIGWSVSKLVRKVLLGLYVDAYLVGDKAAQAVLAGAEQVDWGEWTPGSPAETRLLIAANGMDPGLQDVLADAGRISEGINSTRVREVAKALSDAVGGQPTVDDLSTELADILTDEAMVGRIAVTEVSRAVSGAALTRYDLARLNGLTELEWVAAADACPRCQENAAGSPVRFGQPFPTGSYSPPEHPSCRCAIFPYRS
jgi:hypothetical protein